MAPVTAVPAATTAPPVPAVTIPVATTGQIDPIINAPPGIPASPSYTASPENFAKNLTEQEAVSIPSIPGPSTQEAQATSKVNFTSAVAGSYGPIGSASHVYPTQPLVNFTPGK